MAKRILVVTQHFWPENFRINDMVEGFLQDGLEVDVLCGLPNYPKGEWFDGYSAQGPWEEHYGTAQVFRAKEWPRKGNTSVNIFLNYVSWPLYAWRALDRLPGGYDAVFCFNTSPVLMCWPAIRYAKKHKIPFTNYVLDLWPENLYSVLPVKNSLLRRIAQGVSDHLYRKADRLIAMSGPLQQRLCQRTGKPETAVAAIPQYCEDFYAVPQPDEELAARFAGRFNLVFTGTFTPAQSLDMVLRAVLDARAAGAENLHLLLVGDGMSRESLQDLARELNAGDAVTFYGSVPAQEVPRFTTLADALLISLSDSPDLGLTVPGKLASYMAAGKPVIASMNGAGAEAVRESGGGLVSPACDQQALAENLLRLYRMDPAGRTQLGEKAKAYYLAHYRRAELLRRLETFILQGE
ncbi:MAG TPA: glycosyltransferase family 4 protein [Candidatus Gemmiger excrementavium]|uniref:Glycosyltransferase family 4 protein n=1 Tax=Candidatus Gemmiger excrementavium TaxID=2838608 RepID=A0A9D2F2K5_9FIRM|nr:glycosyltransferase family 4 protein [Candidatus Gemmiger excrementavium]